ncbi:hypothetical protein [Bacteriovorax sp. DB6_IX]|uniref:hypothetical protein n=1 Tax=Bacteriovorax sp. DB6_IX TaxID=1353530 RepID=UPI0018E02DCC|nr:hypothetical protein [Bacteriovorax sp. DB6_IX]
MAVEIKETMAVSTLIMPVMKYSGIHTLIISIIWVREQKNTNTANTITVLLKGRSFLLINIISKTVGIAR